jgi:hypothetical protein
VALAAALAGCHPGGAGSTGVRLPAGSTVLARGSLAYAVAFADDGGLVSIELEERFALVVRSPDGRRRGRFDLGPPERDLPALAVAGGLAWVGGADRRVRGLALDGGAVVASWPIGAAVTSLAATAELLAVGDADGAVCLRRLPDGALLQCVQLASAPIDSLAIAGERLRATSAGPRGRRWALTLPSLALVAAPMSDAPSLRRAGREVIIDGAVVVRLAGIVRAIAVDGRGRIAIAGWVARLDDPSVVLIPPRAAR